MNWNDISYLKRGNHRQRQAYAALHSLDIFNRLAAYSPVLVGTVPLSIDIFESDLDVLCYAQDLTAFAALLPELYRWKTNFEMKTRVIRGVPSVVAGFEHAGVPVEIFAQAVPVEQQNGYRHMIVEYRLLTLGGEEMAESIRQLKQDGLKTEPAFAQYLHLDGDPYQALLDLENLDDAALQKLIPA